MFRTCFSYFSQYFHILVFLQNRYLLISSRPFLAAQESNFLSRFSYLLHYKVVRCTCAPIFQAQNALVSQSKTLSVFCRRFLERTSIGQTRICRRPSRYVPYKGTFVPYDGTFGASDQGQTLDV